ncbi:MAG TPA: ATP-dependent Clp protease ATP-binding subunit [Thermomicrobiales bacterium]|nr:ATP-dependent Clp protease ATP-binding subunit [Thermomicrobiales bacterium]
MTASNVLDLHTFSVSAIRALNMGVAIMRRFGHRALTTEHLLLALLNQSDGNANKILQHFGVDLFAVRAGLEQYLAEATTVPLSDLEFEADGGRRLPLAPNLALVLDRARVVADGYRLAWVGTDHLLAAIVQVENPAGALLKRYGVSAAQIDDALRTINKGGAVKGEGNTEIVVDLVAAAKAAANVPTWPKVVERADPLRDLVNILLQRRRNSVLIVGEPGSGRRSLVVALAQLAARDQAPTGIPGAIWALQPGALLGNPETNVEMALRVARGGILLVPDLPLFFGGSAFPGYAEAGMAIRGALTSPNGDRVRLVGTATTQGYNKYLDPDGTLAVAAAPLRLEPPSAEEAVPMLEAHRPALEHDYKVTFAPDALPAATTLAQQYLPGALPATALAALERACVLVQLAGAAAPELRPAGIAPEPLVDKGDVAAAVGAMSGVAVGQMVGPERERLARMEQALHARVIGQDEAIAAVSRAYRRARAGFRDVKRPIGSFLFLGPSGVGKTETARALAEFLFGSEDATVRIDMSEYMEKHAVARLVGAPPGYVGYEEGGQLTEAVRRKPSSVVLFDEIEKAHPDVYNLFLQILDDGRLTDGKGRRVDFRNTIIIMTSNLGTEYILGEGTEHAGAPLPEETRDQIEEVLRSHFRPEFLNRIDKIVIFTPLSREQLRLVLELQLARVYDMARNAGLHVEITEPAKDWLLAQNHEPEFGARPIRRIVQDYVLDALVDGLTDAQFAAGDTVRIDAPGEGPLMLTRVEGTAAPAASAEEPAAAAARPLAATPELGAPGEHATPEPARKAEAEGG